MKMVVASCSLVEVYLDFEGVFCLHHQGDKQAAFHSLDQTLLMPPLHHKFTWSY
jgi:hypothetical protein